MLPTYIQNYIQTEQNRLLKKKGNSDFTLQPFSPLTYYKDITKSLYMDALLIIRHAIKMATHHYFTIDVGAHAVDLFMLTSSVSSPMGPGSDSEPIDIQFGDLKTFLVDSSQFGFEPLLLNTHDKLYCYAPSMRGEDPDDRHLNQFYHSELEMRGTFTELIPVVEGYIRILAEVIAAFDGLLGYMSVDVRATKEMLSRVLSTDIPKFSFDEVVRHLEGQSDVDCLVNFTDHGRDITVEGESRIFDILNIDVPIWVTGYDRDRVPFYQKPDPENERAVINGDLIVPPVSKDGFRGEILGAGQRQDEAEEMYESINRQNGSAEPYEWYIDIRRDPRYQTTSGFGLGIERFLAWVLGRKAIQDVSVYPRLKNIKMYP